MEVRGPQLANKVVQRAQQLGSELRGLQGLGVRGETLGMHARQGQPIGQAQDVLLLGRAEGELGGDVVVDLGLGQ
eukprot:5281625-Pyramimonas_sp.AAC.1